jgi:hypothetical protein
MQFRALLAILLLASASVADAGTVWTLQPNYDDTLDSRYPLGDKPIVHGACTNGWLCEHIGSSTGEIDTTSATTIEISTAGFQDTSSYEFVYKAFSSGNVQVCATVPDQSTWTGYHENFTGFGVKITDGLLIPDYFSQAWNPYISDIPRHKIGTLLANGTTQGDPLTAGPETVCETFHDLTDEWRGWQSNDGVTFTQVGATTVQAPAGTLYAGAFGVSQEAGQTSFATLTNVTASSTITVYSTASAPTFSVAPAVTNLANTAIDISFTLDQSGTVYGVACPNGQSAPSVAQVKAGACASAGVVDAFSNSVAATVADSDQFNGLTAATTYDLHFAANNPTNGDTAAIVTIADQTTGGGVQGTCMAPLAGPTNGTISTGMFLTANVNCRRGNDIVAGWDFSLPAETPIAARGGIFDGSTGAFPSYFTGNRLFECNFKWDELEPTNDSWTAGEAKIDACLGAHAGYNGAWLNFRGTQVKIRDCESPGNPTGTVDKHTSEWNAPDWIRASYSSYLTQQGCNEPGKFQIYSLDIDDDNALHDPDGAGPLGTPHDEYFEFIQHYATYMAAHHSNKNFWQMMHVSSGSRGEECCGGVSNGVIIEIINTWSDTYRAVSAGMASRLSWMDTNDPYFGEAVTDGGTGVRGGIIERWLQSVFTPGNVSKTGITRDTNGYMTVSQTFLPISQLRMYMDENEECDDPAKFGQVPADWALCEMETTLRILQMRRNVLWIDQGMILNQRVGTFAAQEMGHTPATQPDGWTQLMETRGPNLIVLKNFERGIGQREVLGATTVTLKTDFGFNAINNTSTNPPPTSDSGCNFGGNNHCYAIAMGRRGASIGFFVDDAFWPTTVTNDAVFKLTYVSTASKTITIKKGATTLCTINAIGSTAVRTATCFVDNYNPSAAGQAQDFSVDSDGTVDLMFVRLIKDGGVGAKWGP